MSQRRQEARRAKQERRREARHQNRTTQRRTAVLERPQQREVAPARAPFWTRRNRWIVTGAVAGLIALALIFWIVRSVRAPLPGEKFESQGNAHLSDPSQVHEPYNSNPPTSGPHLPPVPRPGIYTQPKIPEDLGHYMEHGGVWVLYNCPDGCEADVQALTNIVDSAIDAGRPVALAPFPSMETKVAVVAWQYLLKLDSVDRKQIDNFIGRHACRYNPEGGPYCTGVRGKVKDAKDNQSLPVVTGTPFSVFGTATPAATTTP